MTSVFFIPICEMLISIYGSIYNESNVLGYYNQNGNIIHIAIGTLVLIVFLLITFVVINSLYDLKYKGSPFSTKKTIKNDNVFFFNKCLIVVLNCFVVYSNKTLPILGIICFFLFYQTYIYYTVNCFDSFLIQKTYSISSIVLAWTFVILFLNHLTINYSIIGSICTFWLISVCLIIICNAFLPKRTNYSLLMSDFPQINNSDALIEQVEEIIDLLYSKKRHRMSRIIIFGYIHAFNLRYVDKTYNPLKNYFNSLNETKNINFFIFHLSEVLKIGLSKFPTCIRLRIYYALFIYENLFKREQALKELEYTKRFSLNFSQRFLIYRLTKEIHIQLYPQLGDSILLSYNNKESSITYKILLYEFKHLISDSAMLYNEFWTLLSNANGKSTSNNQIEYLSKLNSIGIHIKKDVDSIQQIFEQLVQLKPYDQDIILDYWYFVTNILNDKEKETQLVNKLKDIVNLTQSINEENLCHIDLKRMFVHDDYPFIIFSAMPKSLGIITHISMSLCSLFGYEKEELIGKQIETLLPGIYTQAHQRFLLNIINYYKNKLYDNYSLFQNFKIEFKDELTYAVNKSKYLLPINSKATFFPNEDGNEYFYMKLVQDNSPSSIPYKHHICYILTDLNLFIQNFTANSINLLGLNSEYICSSKLITDNIRQFHEDYLKTILDIENERKEDNKHINSIELKHKLIHRKYSFPTPITWMIDSDKDKKVKKGIVGIDEQSNCYSNNLFEESSTFMFLSSKNMSTKSKKYNTNIENYMLIVHDYGHLGDNQGFIFQFEPISYYNLRNSSCSHYNPPSSSKVLHSMALRDDKKKSLFLEVENKEIGNSFKEKEKDIINIDKLDFKQLKVGSTGFNSNSNFFKLHKQYIPELTLQFAVNPNTHSFYQTIQLDKDQFLNHIKKQVESKNNNKINNPTNKDDHIKSEDSSNESECSSSFYSSSDSYFQNSTTKLINVSLMSNDNDINGQYDYYQVNISNIKYYLYDFKTRVIRQNYLDNKISEVEVRLFKDIALLNEDKPLQLSTQSSKQLITFNSTLLNLNQNNIQSSGFKPSSKYSSSLATQSTIVKQLSEPTVTSKKEKMKQEIKKALSKDTIQSTVITLYILSAISFIIAISKELIFYFCYLSMIDEITDYVFLIRDSFRLHRNMILTMFSIRELTLINTNMYIQQEMQNDLYIQKCYTLINEYFEENDVVIKNITTTTIQFPIEMITELNSISASNCLINTTNRFSFNCYNNTFFSSISAYNHALHNIHTTDITQLIPTNDDIYYVMYNVMNSIWLGADKFNEFCIKLFILMHKNIIWKLVGIFCGCELLLGLIYCIARKGLVDAMDENDSYLTIFFGIDKEDLIFLLKKSEKFTNHFQNNKIKDKYNKKEMHKEDKENDSNCGLRHGIFQEKSIDGFNPNTILEPKTTSIIEVPKNKNQKQSNKNNKLKSKNDKKTKCTGLFLFGHVFIILGSIGVLIFDTFMLFQMISFKKEIKLSIDIYESQARIQRQSLLLFNLLRESVFETNAYFRNIPLNSYLEEEIVNIYNKIQKENQNIKEIIQHLSYKIYSFYFMVNFKSLCSSSENEFRCSNYTDNAASYVRLFIL